MSNEVTREELLTNFDILVGPERSTGWTRDISIKGEGDSDYTQVLLRWDEDYGYMFEVFGDIPNSLKSFMTRPEFEYMLDSVTNGEE